MFIRAILLLAFLSSNLFAKNIVNTLPELSWVVKELTGKSAKSLLSGQDNIYGDDEVTFRHQGHSAASNSAGTDGAGATVTLTRAGGRPTVARASGRPIRGCDKGITKVCQQCGDSVVAGALTCRRCGAC